MIESVPTLAIVALGAALGGFVQGLSGFAFGLVALSLWAWVLPPQVVAPLVVFGALTGQVASFASFRGGFDRRIILPLIAGGLFGVPIGVFLLHNVDPRGFKLAFGVLLIAYSLVGWVAPRLPKFAGGGQGADAAAGFVGGVFGGLGGMAGTVPASWGLLRGWRPEARRAAMQVYNIAMHVLTLTLYWRTGALQATPWTLYALVLPAMLGPAYWGAKVIKKASETTVTRVILACLFASGLALIAGASRGMSPLR